MFIREITNKNYKTGKAFVFHRVLEAVDTPKGPRRRFVPGLWRLGLPRTQLKTLAGRIEQIICVQKSLWTIGESIKNLRPVHFKIPKPGWTGSRSGIGGGPAE
jgi:hypothetical protein